MINMDIGQIFNSIMAELTQREVTQATTDALSISLREYTAGRGQQYLQVILAGDEAKNTIEQAKKLNEEATKLNKNVNKLSDGIETNNDLLQDDVSALDENTKASKDTTKALKEHGISLGAILKKSVDLLSATSGYVYERTLREVELTQKISETNVMYSKTAKELDNYANAMNMTLDEYTQFMKENAAEYNTFTRVFKDAVIGEGVQWNKIAAQSGATQNEMNKALATYTKMVSRNGDINSMTIDQFNEGASQYIKETKLLAKALGVSTDAILKQTEQAEKQWQLDLMMTDPSKREAVQAAQAAGHSIDQIMYEFNGVITEQFAAQMATNEQIRIEAQSYKQAADEGNLKTQRDFLEVSNQLSKNEQWLRANAQNEARFSDKNFQTMAMYAGQEFYNVMGGNEWKESAATIKNVGENFEKIIEEQKQAEEEGKEGPYETMGAIVDFNSKIVENQNRIETLLMPGSELSTTLGTMSSTMGLVNNGIGKLENLLSQDWAQKILSGMALTGMVFTSFQPFISGSMRFLSWLPKLAGLDNISKNTLSLNSSFNGVKTMFKGVWNHVGVGVATAAVGKHTYDAYEKYKEGDKLGAVENGLRAGTVGLAAGIGGKIAGDKGALVATAVTEGAIEGVSKVSEKFFDWILGNDKKKESPAQKMERMMKERGIQPKTFQSVQENKPANVAQSQVQNKAEIQAEAKIKAESEAEAKQQTEQQLIEQDGTPFSDNVVKEEKTKTVKLLTEEDMQSKFSQMVSLMTEMNNYLGQMAMMPMNNYQNV